MSRLRVLRWPGGRSDRGLDDLLTLMQDVQALMRLVLPFTTARTRWMLGFQRRGVRRCEWETRMPKPGPLPQTSQTEATGNSKWCRCSDRSAARCRRRAGRASWVLTDERLGRGARIRVVADSRSLGELPAAVSEQGRVLGRGARRCGGAAVVQAGGGGARPHAGRDRRAERVPGPGRRHRHQPAPDRDRGGGRAGRAAGRRASPRRGALAQGALLGARGNSGVILSQVFRGLADVLGPLEAPPDGAAFAGRSGTPRGWLVVPWSIPWRDDPERGRRGRRVVHRGRAS